MEKYDMIEPLAMLAAQKIIESRAFIITAGAGMSADSGLPTFRGNEVLIIIKLF